MNKRDLFAKRLPHSPLGDHFPDYQGRDNHDSACDYYRLYRFVSLNPAGEQIRIFYICVCYAVDCLYVCACFWGFFLTLGFFAPVADSYFIQLCWVLSKASYSDSMSLGNYNRFVLLWRCLLKDPAECVFVDVNS